MPPTLFPQKPNRDLFLAAVGEAAGAIVVMRDRLRENELANAQSVLALGNAIEERWASEWWVDFSRMDQDEFERTAGDLVGPQGRGWPSFAGWSRRPARPSRNTDPTNQSPIEAPANQSRFNSYISLIHWSEGKAACPSNSASLPTDCRGLKVCDMPRSLSRRLRKRL
jgi:hypothetical protein